MVTWWSSFGKGDGSVTETTSSFLSRASGMQLDGILGDQLFQIFLYHRLQKRSQVLMMLCIIQETQSFQNASKYLPNTRKQ